MQEPEKKSWYPTIIGYGGDQECGQQARLYYTTMMECGDREYVGRDIVFFRPGEPGANSISSLAELGLRGDCFTSLARDLKQ